METIVVGGDQRPWSEGGGDENTQPPSNIPVFRMSLQSREALSGNAPGLAVDFASEPGWLAPLRVDPEINIFRLIRNQGGAFSIRSPNNFDIPRGEMLQTLLGVTDGSATVYVRKSTPLNRNVNPQGEHIDIDLGAPFGLERIVFYPSSFFPADHLKAFEIRLNDGTDLTEAGNPIWTLAFRQGQNTRSRTEVQIPLQLVRHLRLTSLTSAGFEIDEIELYGRGYVPDSRFLSDVFDLGRSGALWGRIQWAAEAVGDPDKPAMFVRTRSGDTPSPLILTRTVVSATLGEELFTVKMGRIAYERAGLGLTLAPLDMPGQVVDPEDYALLSEEVRAWLEEQGAAYTLLDENGRERGSTRPEFEAAGPGNQASVTLGALLISADTYVSLPTSVRDWIEQRGVEYFRRASDGENVPYGLDGEHLTLADYNGLADAERGPILEDTENWSPWSEPYLESEGSQITSPAPRRFLQFEISFTSDLEAAWRVDSLSFEVSHPPIAQRLLAEIFPRHVQPGRSEEFTYAVRALKPSAGGFNSFEIVTPVPVERLEEIQILDGQGAILEERRFGVDLDGLALPFSPEGENEWSLVSVDPNLRVRFPPITDDGSVLKLRFVTSVLRFGTGFEGWAFNEVSGQQEREEQGLPQPVVPGNVAQLAPGDEDNRSSLTVFTDLEGVALLSAVEADPNPFTPNGDGVNDGTEISWDLLKLTEGTPVEVVIYDLSGRRVRALFADELANGRYGVPWDGSDGGNRLVPPGLYLFEISVKADREPGEALGTIAVVY